jgi:hypothetical protein
MESAEGEKVLFPSPVMTQGPTENWLGEVESTMRLTIKSEIKKALLAYPAEVCCSGFRAHFAHTHTTQPHAGQRPT